MSTARALQPHPIKAARKSSKWVASDGHHLNRKAAVAGNVIQNVKVLGFASVLENMDAEVEGEESRLRDSSNEKAKAAGLGASH